MDPRNCTEFGIKSNEILHEIVVMSDLTNREKICGDFRYTSRKRK